MTKRELRRCSRCNRRLRNMKAEGWNAVLDLGVVIALLCPTCQTPEEHAEAAINDATTDYAMFNGFHVGRAKSDIPE